MQSSLLQLPPKPLFYSRAPLVIGGGSFLFIPAVAPSPVGNVMKLKGLVLYNKVGDMMESVKK
jgi:hypothetical protein